MATPSVWSKKKNHEHRKRQNGISERTHSEFDIGREEGKFLAELLGESSRAGGVGRNADVAGSYDTLLAIQGAKDFSSEFGTGISHGERRRSSAVLRLDDFITTELNTVYKSVMGLLREARR